MAVILKLGKKYQITYEVVTSTKEIKMIKELFDNYEDAAKRKELLDGVTIAAIGPVTAETAEKLGLKADIIADEYTIDGLVQALVKYYQK